MSPNLQDPDPALEQYRALVDVSQSIALNRDLPGLFHDLAEGLHHVVPFDYLNLVLHEPERHTMRLHVLETREPSSVMPGIEHPVEETPSGLVWLTQVPLVIPDVSLEQRFPRIVEMLRSSGVRTVCMLPLTTAQRRLGALGFGSKDPDAYRSIDLPFLGKVAAQVAVAVDNALNYERAQCYQRQLARERDRLRVVLDITNVLVSNLDLREMFTTASALLRGYINHDYLSLVVAEPEGRLFRIYALDFPESRGLIRENMAGTLEDSPAGEAIAARRLVLFGRGDLERYSSEFARRLLDEGIQSAACAPLIRGERLLGVLSVASRRDGAFSEDDLELLSQIANEVSIAVENARAFREIRQLKDKLDTERLYLEDEIRTEYNFEEMIGESSAWRRVLRDIETVAPTDSTVLIHGESGTGKELIARAIHNLSGRRERTLVKVNCAAIPTGLLESELFGHEKGAFTGAIGRRTGRFEMADRGTLLLDEIGDIPLELQPKLLRVLQEREFERLGSTATVRVDVRLITSTNRDLSRMVADKEFRGDLFYRLNVFPIMVPPLRERREDIPLLARYFTQKFARRMNKPIETVPTASLEALTRWNWPGNVRELENLIERAVILTRGPVLHVPLAEIRNGAEASTVRSPTLEDFEREHILEALREAGGVIGGPHGAAARLGLKRTTLQSRMRKLGIGRSSIGS